tara:strand:+ start:180 stop:500 length:321 start_codon:yes stop_codon:yes gene_type:complete
MNLLELLHNESVIKILEKIDNQLLELKESNGDFSSVFPSIIFMLEMILSKHDVSTITNIIYKKKEIEDLLLYINSSYENKDTIEQKITTYLEKNIITNKKLNYGNI